MTSLRTLSLSTLVALATALPCALRAEPVTAERVATVPAAEQGAWQEYLARSQALALADQAALQAELQKLGLAEALPAPEGADFKLPGKPEAAWFGGDEAGRLADIVLSYQTPAGGWSKHTDYAAGLRKPGMLWSSQYKPGAKPHYLGTFDNRSTTEQLRLLAGVWKATGREECRNGVLRGIDYILAAQYPNGGWPQVYPIEGGYHDDITFNDDAMTRVLGLLQSITEGDPVFSMVEGERRAKVAKAFDAGLRCVLALQIKTDAGKAVWCAQHDALTLAPANARKMEPASISGGESVGILKFLMSLKSPSPEVVASIEAGLAWLDKARITNLTRTKVGGKTVYQVAASSTETYWARFYDLKTGKPIFPGRDGVVYTSYEEMISKNKGGYDYLTTSPNSLLGNGQKNWRKQLAKAQRS